MLLLLSSLLLALCCSVAAEYPPDFHFGTATAAFQIEGAFARDGRLPVEFDLFAHYPGRVTNNDNADIADDSYDRWPVDISLMAAMNVTAHRFSIPWSRIIDQYGNVNALGVAHYSKFIDALLEQNITPFVTMYHGDLPLQFSTYWNSSHGFLNAEYFIPHWLRYADALFQNFGSRVAHWITFNEPYQICVPFNYPDPLRGSYDTSKAMYNCAHTAIMAHAHTVKLYREKYESQFGAVEFGMTLDGDFAIPYTDSPADQEAAERHLLFTIAMFGDPLYFGDWPAVMKQRLPPGTLPVFTPEQQQLLKATVPDYFAHNHYASHLYRNNPNATTGEGVIATDFYPNGQPVGPLAASSWLRVVPWGFRAMLHWQNNRYQPKRMYIFENGCDVPNESNTPFPQVLQDDFRILYLEQYIGNMTQAMQEGVPLKGYFVWSLLDNFEWGSGFELRFGLHYVDYKTLQRYPKQSAIWYGKWVTQQRQIAAVQLEEQAVQPQ